MFHTDPVGHRYFKPEGPAAMRFDLTFHILRQIVTRMVIKSYVRTLAGKKFTNCRTDSARSARHKGAFSFK